MAELRLPFDRQSLFGVSMYYKNYLYAYEQVSRVAEGKARAELASRRLADAPLARPLSREVMPSCLEKRFREHGGQGLRSRVCGRQRTGCPA